MTSYFHRLVIRDPDEDLEVVLRHLLPDPILSSGAKGLYIWLYIKYSECSPGTFPHQKMLADDLNVHTVTVGRWERELIRHGRLERW